MTNKDAIILLKDCKRIFENGKDRTADKALFYLEQHIEALNMAIYALEQSKEEEMTRLKAENERLTAELEKSYEFINSIREERSRQVCPFGDDREKCAFYKANGCDCCFTNLL